MGWWQEALTLGKALEKGLLPQAAPQEASCGSTLEAQSTDLLTPQRLCLSRASHHMDTPPPAHPGWALCQVPSFGSLDGERRQWEGHLDDCKPSTVCPRKPGECHLNRRVTEPPTNRAWAALSYSTPVHFPPFQRSLSFCCHGLKSSGRRPAGTRKHAYMSEAFLSRLWGSPGQGPQLILHCLYLFLFLEFSQQTRLRAPGRHSVF